jgi:hypothetical protein
MHKDRMGIERDGQRVCYFMIDEGGIKSSSSVEILFLGQVHQEIEFEGTDSNGFQFARLRLVYFGMEGDHPKFGRIRIAHDTQRPGTFATLLASKPGQKFPVIHTTYLNILAVADNMPGVVLQNKGAPLRFVSDPLQDWPPRSNIYTLKTDVEFEERQNPGPVVMAARKSVVLLEKA